MRLFTVPAGALGVACAAVVPRIAAGVAAFEGIPAGGFPAKVRRLAAAHPHWGER
jgi:hypothetical protein